MEANVFYDDGTVKVTRTLFEAGSTQFPIRNIASVQIFAENPERKGPIICIVVGVLLLAAFVGILIIAAGIYWWISQKTIYWIEVYSGGSKSRAYGSPDIDTIRKIQSAINQALELH
ncbi:MAG: DUF6232 family protein [Pseudanabaenaceae cyanobacterium]|jgi:hypothetical protein